MDKHTARSPTSSSLSSAPSEFDDEAYSSDDHFDDVPIISNQHVASAVAPSVSTDVGNITEVENAILVAPLVATKDLDDEEEETITVQPATLKMDRKRSDEPGEDRVPTERAARRKPVTSTENHEELLSITPDVSKAGQKNVVQKKDSASVHTSSAVTNELEENTQPNKRTSGRKRMNLKVADEDEDEEGQEQEEKYVTKKSAPIASRKRAPVRGNFTPNFLLQNPKSKLTTVDLAELLSVDAAWTSLTREQQLHLISMLPGEEPPNLPDDVQLPNIPLAVLKSNSSFRADVRLFQEDLEAGRYDPKWLEDAKAASEERASGKFDDWKEKNREQFWGQKQKMNWTANAGESSQHSLGTLVAAGCFEVGDVWVLSRGLRAKERHLTVEKEATITAISSNHTLTFTFPPDQHKFSSSVNGADLVVSNIGGPKELSDAILAEDGRIVNVRGGNSWREFRCFRRNQDIGGLWDVRELYHSRL